MPFCFENFQQDNQHEYHEVGQLYPSTLETSSLSDTIEWHYLVAQLS